MQIYLIAELYIILLFSIQQRHGKEFIYSLHRCGRFMEVSRVFKNCAAQKWGL